MPTNYDRKRLRDLSEANLDAVVCTEEFSGRSVLSLLDQLEAVEREREQAVSHKVELNKMLGVAQQELAASQQETERLRVVRRLLDQVHLNINAVVNGDSDEGPGNWKYDCADFPELTKPGDGRALYVGEIIQRALELTDKEGGVEP